MNKVISTLSVLLCILCAVATTTAYQKSDSIKKTSDQSGLSLPLEKASNIRITRFETAPVIDGKLDDDVWKVANIFKDFTQIHPGDNVAPSKQTEVMIGYDAKNLYFAFRCYDEPDKIRATVAKRDTVFNEDNVRVLLDTFNDQRKAYVIGFNPLGIQQDGIMTDGEGIDYNVDIVMESKGVITDSGWIVEAAIPFKSLRYYAGKGKLWGIHIWRNIDRFNDELDSWMPLSRNIIGTMNQAGKITGLENISTERTLEIIPTVTLSEAGKRVAVISNIAEAGQPPKLGTSGSRFINNPAKADIGVSAKYSITPTVTLDFTYNPDFADVEADAPVVQANQRFPIFFPEKRPFFLEGVDIFDNSMDNLNTRTIVDPDFAAKLTGKRGLNSFGFFLTSDKAPGNFSKEERRNPFLNRQIERYGDKNSFIGVLRLKRDTGKENSIGMMMTNYNYADKHNQLLSFDSRIKFNKNTIFNAQVTGTYSKRCFFDPAFDPQTDSTQAKVNSNTCFANSNKEYNRYRIGNGFGYFFSLDRSTRRFTLSLEGIGRTQDFRADAGFVRRVNSNNQELSMVYRSEPKSNARFISWNIGNDNEIRYDWQGRIQSWESEAYTFLSFKHNTFIRFGYNKSYEKVYEEEFGPKRNLHSEGTFFASSERSTHGNQLNMYGSTVLSKKILFNTSLDYNLGVFDFDYSGGPKFPRVSRAAIMLGEDAPLDPGVANGFDFNTNATFKPIDKLNFSLDFTESQLTRQDTKLQAFDSRIFSFRSTYQFTRFSFVRARIDYDSLDSNARGQFLFGLTPKPGTAFYLGYNDDVKYNGYDNYTNRYIPRFQRNSRTFFIKLSYLIRKSI